MVEYKARDGEGFRGQPVLRAGGRGGTLHTGGDREL
jgi:hypothetical protein